jgi:probable rRNA maturation factor
MNSATDTAAADRDDPGSSAGESDPPPESARSHFDRCGDTTCPCVIDVCSAGAPAIDALWLRDRLEDVIAELRRPVKRVSVSVLDDGSMRELHRRYLNIDDTTDVLTFPAGSETSIDVDIAVCVDEAGRQAVSREHGVEQELLLYALHGLLHCAGYDDHDEAGFNAMHAEEDRILDAIGVGKTFGRTAGPRRSDA